MTEALERLREAMAGTPRPTPFVGTGLSLAATGGAIHASCRGLIADGIEVCERVVSPLPPGWASRMRDQLDNADVVTYVAVADEITRRLRAVRGGREFGYWIRRTVGGLRPTAEGEQLIGAVRRLGKVIVTTNYDTLIEDAGPPWRSSTWTDQDYNFAVRSEQVVVHLHGFAKNPDSIILSSADYERLSQEARTQVLNKSLFASHRFIFIGCGDDLGDPDIAPLIDFVNKVMPGESTEHYILVRGEQLRELNEHPISPLIVPVAYGDSFDDLAPFLQKLAGGEQIQISQDPKFYDEPRSTRPRTALLDLVAPAWEKLQDAQDVLRRAIRTMDQVESRSAMPKDMRNWDYRDQKDVHEQLAASVTDPAAHLESCSEEVVRAFKAVEDDVGQLGAPRFAEYAADLTPMIDIVSRMESLSGQLLDKATRVRDDLYARKSICADYRIPHETVSRAHKYILDVSRIVTTLGEGLDRLVEVHTAKEAPPSRPAPMRPALHVVRSEGEAAEPNFWPVPVRGKAAGGEPILPSGEDLEYLPLPAQYTQRDDAFAVRVKGESMIGDDIYDGDYVIVVPDPEPKDGEIVLVLVDNEEGEATIKRLRRENSTVRLESSNPAFKPIILGPDAKPIIQGRVIRVVTWRVR